MNLCLKYPIIFWNCACLITDSGGEDGGTDYDKIAVAIGKLIKSGTKIRLPDINKAMFGFIPDVENNQILFGMKGLAKVSDDIVKLTIENRPYISIKDYINKVNPTRQAMISLIKCGAFDNLIDRKIAMGWYIWETCDKKKNLTMQNMPALIKYNLLPNTNESKTSYKIYEFNRYLKSKCKSEDAKQYVLDDRSINFLTTISCEKIININNNKYTLSTKEWDKVYQSYMDYFKNWIKDNNEIILNNLNKLIFKDAWDKDAKGNFSSWEMETLCFYYHDHELSKINNNDYGFIDFYKLDENPVIESSTTIKSKDLKINHYKIFRICGTCIAKNKNKSTVSILTTTGVVEIKFQKEIFAMYNKKISEVQPDGSKKTIETSWFDRGSMIAVQGFRRDDNFVAKKYASTSGHILYKIDGIENDGSLILRSTRLVGDTEEDE